jgi:hypothetical protein
MLKCLTHRLSTSENGIKKWVSSRLVHHRSLRRNALPMEEHAYTVASMTLMEVREIWRIFE